MLHENLETIRKLFGHKFPRWGPLGYNWFLRNHPASIKSELFPGIRMDLDLKDDAQRTFYYYGDRYEFPTGKVLVEWCSDASLFFDIGANFGFFSLLLRSKKLAIKIIGFEPHPAINQRLQTIIKANKLFDIQLESCGLSDRKARLPLHPGKDNKGQSTFGDHPDLKNETVAHVDVLPFDDYCESRNLAFPKRPEWVAKIDVEGYDLKVLKGMERALQKKAFKGISIEVNDFNLSFCGTTAEELRDYLHSKGYRQLSKGELPRGKSTTDNEFYVPATSNA